MIRIVFIVCCIAISCFDILSTDKIEEHAEGYSKEIFQKVYTLRKNQDNLIQQIKEEKEHPISGCDCYNYHIRCLAEILEEKFKLESVFLISTFSNTHDYCIKEAEKLVKKILDQ